MCSAHGLCAAVVDAVEEQFERAVRLRPPGDLVAEEHDPSLPECRLDDRHGLIEILLPPGPATAQRRAVLVPGDWSHARSCSLRLKPEGGALVVEHHRA